MRCRVILAPWFISSTKLTGAACRIQMISFVTRFTHSAKNSFRMQRSFSAAIEGPFNFVENKRCEPADKLNDIDNFEPSTGKVLHTFGNSGQKEVNRAIMAAKEAYPSWSKVGK